ncbi:hypothetical protein HYW74_04010 [Candidatus Pacearchaeota archaeon]|nr:hypothetical protein [Candidatus Pacearchaeota archaeon]
MKEINPEALKVLSRSVLDADLSRLIDLVARNYDNHNGISIVFDRDGNFYAGCVSRINETELKEYFGDELNKESLKSVWKALPDIPSKLIDPSGNYGYTKYAKKFTDGAIQFLTHGEFWSSKPGRAWAVYGHVLPRSC